MIAQIEAGGEGRRERKEAKPVVCEWCGRWWVEHLVIWRMGEGRAARFGCCTRCLGKMLQEYPEEIEAVTWKEFAASAAKGVREWMEERGGGRGGLKVEG